MISLNCLFATIIVFEHFCPFDFTLPQPPKMRIILRTSNQAQSSHSNYLGLTLNTLTYLIKHVFGVYPTPKSEQDVGLTAS